MQSFASHIFGVVGPLGENVNFLVHWDLTCKQILITKPQKIKLYSVRAVKRYPNEKNLLHSRVMATISAFCPQIFETYFKLQLHDAIYQLRFYSNSLIHILSLSISNNNVASLQKNRGENRTV